MYAHAKASPDRKWYRLTSPVPVFHPSSFGHHVAAPREARTVGVRECLTARLRPRGLRRAPRFVLRTSRGCATRSPNCWCEGMSDSPSSPKRAAPGTTLRPSDITWLRHAKPEGRSVVEPGGRKPTP